MFVCDFCLVLLMLFRLCLFAGYLRCYCSFVCFVWWFVVCGTLCCCLVLLFVFVCFGLRLFLGWLLGILCSLLVCLLLRCLVC